MLLLLSSQLPKELLFMTGGTKPNDTSWFPAHRRITISGDFKESLLFNYRITQVLSPDPPQSPFRLCQWEVYELLFSPLESGGLHDLRWFPGVHIPFGANPSSLLRVLNVWGRFIIVSLGMVSIILRIFFPKGTHHLWFPSCNQISIYVIRIFFLWNCKTKGSRWIRETILANLSLLILFLLWEKAQSDGGAFGEVCCKEEQ